MNDFNRKTSEFRLPITDFDGAVEGLFRLQLIYDLNPEDLAQGVIQDKKYRDDLTANELYALGSGLNKLQMNSVALSYLNLALKKNEQQPEMSSEAILEGVLMIHNQTGEVDLVIETLDKILKITPERKDLEDLRDDLELKRIFEDTKKSKKAKKTSDVKEHGSKVGVYSQHTDPVIEACNNRLKQAPELTSKLRCRFVGKTDFVKIAPFKVEEVNLDPYVAIFHEVISEDEIKAFKELSKENLNRATVLERDATSKVSLLSTIRIQT